MRDIMQFVQKAMSTNRLGGRVSQRDASTIVLYDMSTWGDAQSDTLRSSFPECEISLMVSSSSMSGFIVIIKRHSRHVESLWAAAFVLMGLAVVYTGNAVYSNAGGGA
jgi:hypothetical protein